MKLLLRRATIFSCLMPCYDDVQTLVPTNKDKNNLRTRFVMKKRISDGRGLLQKKSERKFMHALKRKMTPWFESAKRHLRE